MQTRTNKEVLEIAIKLFSDWYKEWGGGLCIFIEDLFYEKKVITELEYNHLKIALKASKPKRARKGYGYWWELGKKGHTYRIKHLKRMLKNSN